MSNAAQVGDAGVTFDQSKFDSDYPQMSHWVQAGVRGGIPLVDTWTIRRTVSSGATSSIINAAIVAVAAEGGGAVLLENGTYDIADEVSLKTGVSLIGESREGVECVIDPAMRLIAIAAWVCRMHGYQAVTNRTAENPASDKRFDDFREKGDDADAKRRRCVDAQLWPSLEVRLGLRTRLALRC